MQNFLHIPFFIWYYCKKGEDGILVGEHTMKSSELKEILKVLSSLIEEGVHIVDDRGRTIIYNKTMERLEDTEAEKVIGKYFDDVFSHIPLEESTIKMAFRKNKKTMAKLQSYKTSRGRIIKTINSTLPVVVKGRTVGVIEIAKGIDGTKKSYIDLHLLENDENSDNYLSFDTMIAKNSLMKNCIKQGIKAAKSDVTIAIFGDVGTGKESFARCIHNMSNRSSSDFIAQDCQGLSEARLDEILFGRDDEFFLGNNHVVGLLEKCGNGTLFLDSIEHIPLILQEKLLRALQENYVKRINGSKNIQINCRIIASVGKEPLDLIEKGMLKKELFYRINAVDIKLPSLEDRKEDIVPLFETFIETECKKNKRDIPKILKEAKEKLIAHKYEGNIRELENIAISTVAMLGRKNTISSADINFSEFTNKDYADLIGYVREKDSLDEFLMKVERRIIWETMEKNQNNISKTADLLGMKRQTLQHKLKKYGGGI